MASLITDNEGDFLKVVGHEGRHLVWTLRDKGYEALLVELLVRDGGKDGIVRCGQQLDPQKLDYKEQLPTKIVSELGDKSIDFPVTRKRAVIQFDRDILRNDLLPVITGIGIE